jgi:hypothetical protein
MELKMTFDKQMRDEFLDTFTFSASKVYVVVLIDHADFDREHRERIFGDETSAKAYAEMLKRVWLAHNEEHDDIDNRTGKLFTFEVKVYHDSLWTTK